MSADSATSLRYPAGWFIGVFLALVIFAVIAFISFRVAHNTTSYDSSRAEKRYQLLAKQRADDDKALHAVAWIDQGKGVISIPIDEAMAHEVDDLKVKPVQAGQLLPGLPPPAVATPAALPATNAPSSQGTGTSQPQAPAAQTPGMEAMATNAPAAQRSNGPATPTHPVPAH